VQELQNVPPRQILTLTEPVGAPQLTQARLLGDGQFSMVLEGESNRRYVIEFSTGLITWEDLMTVDYAGSPLVLADPAAASAVRRFYRARLLENLSTTQPAGQELKPPALRAHPGETGALANDKK
jgi:hypothetical protein